MNWVREYMEAIRAGKIVAGSKVTKEYEKLLHEAEDGTSAYFFDEDTGERPIEFVERFCKQAEGKLGEPITLMLWQKAFLQTLFGWKNRSDGSRRFRETMLEVGRKNGKTCLSAALALYMMIADWEGAAECYSVATKRDQAAKCFSYAVHMRQQSPEIRALVRKRRADMYMESTFSTFEPLASDSNSLDGLNSHLVIIDELHAIKDRNLYDVMKQSTSARKQPMLIMITTAGAVRENIFDDMYALANNVLNGIAEDDKFLPILYELDDDSEWDNQNAWEKANPGLGIIKRREYLTDMVKRAKNEPGTLNTVLTKDFNIRNNGGGSWMTYTDIENKAVYKLNDLRSSYAIGGCDLSATTDLTCATLLVMKPGNPVKYVLQMYFLPEELLEKRVREDQIRYDIWKDRKLLRTCPGNRVDYAMVTAWYVEMREKYEILTVWVYYDRALAGYWVQDMESNGFKMVPCAQGAMTFSQPMKTLEADLKDKQVNYNKNPVLEWCLVNTVAQTDANENIRPVKGKNRRQRIDGMVSLLDAYVGLQAQMDNYLALIEENAE
ncbi:MAG: terminase TerL endonuclease subunit [Ethanoligenens sp.]